MVVGLTGGIGSGKSIVARLFELMGCLTFESDVVAKEIYFDPEVRQQVIGLLGAESYLSETTLNKAYISSKIFSDAKLLQSLNSIIHPAVIKKSRLFVDANPGKIVIKETALLFEAKLEKQMDKIILVVADDETRIQRVMQRDGISREEVLKKIDSQLPQEEKIKKADYVIYNSSTQLLTPQVVAVYKDLLKFQHA
ncbi:dephospho-CoA kinase [Sphingobacteriaceae bacterium]|nr:dephospho-CoA kinase [Sphingobacteriaceae bacterium]